MDDDEKTKRWMPYQVWQELGDKHWPDDLLEQARMAAEDFLAGEENDWQEVLLSSEPLEYEEVSNSQIIECIRIPN